VGEDPDGIVHMLAMVHIISSCLSFRYTLPVAWCIRVVVENRG
jgi:hypothetical protein